MPVASRAQANYQRVQLKAIQAGADKSIRVAFAAAHMAMSPEVDRFTKMYANELQKVRNVAVHTPDADLEQQEGDNSATVSILWLMQSGALKRLTDVVQKAATAAATTSAAASTQAAADATDLGTTAGTTLVRLAQPAGKQATVTVNPPAPVQQQPQPQPSAQALSLLQQAQALNPENTDTVGVDETIDPSSVGQTAAQNTQKSVMAGLATGAASQVMQQLAFVGIQGAMTSMLMEAQDASQSAFNGMVNMAISQNPAIVDGWVWTCSGGACIACLEMDGSIHGWDEDLSSHPNCACMQVPITGPLPDDFQTGDQWFNALSDAAQQEILGPAKYEAWKSGDVQLMDFVSKDGGYISERSLKSMGLDARDYLQTLPTAAEKREAQAALDEAIAERNAIAYAPEFPEVPGIMEGALEPGNTMGYVLNDYRGGREALAGFFGHDLSNDAIGALIGAPEHAAVDFVANADGSVKFYLNSPHALDYSATRTLFQDANGRLVMHNESIVIDKALQGHGLGAQIFGTEVKNLSNMGVDRIETAAEGSAATLALNPDGANGFYTWARFGYQANLEDYVGSGLDLNALHEAFPGVQTLQDLMLQPGGPAYWRANGVSFLGVFDLKEGSVSHQMLDSYLAERGIVLQPLEREATTALTKDEALAAIKASEKYYNDIFMAPGAATWDEASDAIVAKLGKAFDYQPLYDALEIKPATITLIENREGNAPSFAVRRMLEEYHTFLGGTSTGSPFQVFLQEAAQREFGAEVALADVRIGSAAVVSQALEQYGEALPEFQQVLRAMYDNTQGWFQERGITEVTLYRGESWTAALKPGMFTFDGEMHTVDLTLKPLSSWSTNLSAASDFAQRHPTAVEPLFAAIERATVPVDQILSVPGTGFGANYLDEMLVLGKTTGADVLAIDTSAGQLAKDKVYDAFAEAATRTETAVVESAATAEDALAAIKAEEQRYKDIFGTFINESGKIGPEEAAAAIVNRLPADFNYASLREVMKITPKEIAFLEKARVLVSGSNLDEYTTLRFLQEYHTFAGGTSTGTPFQIMLQEAAEREFGLTNVQKYWTADKLAAGLDQYGAVLPEFQQVMRAMYDNTQAWFKEQGITEVTLYRGESWAAALRPKDLTYDATIHEQQILLKPLSSWSTTLKVGSEYAQGEGDVALKAYGTIERIQVPIAQVLSVPGTGFGANFLQEVLVLGDKYDADVLALKTTLGNLITHEKVYDAFAEAATRGEVAAVKESPEVLQLRSDRAALQAQKDAIQAKQDILSAKWRTLVLKQGALDPEEEQAAIARMEKQIAGVEKQQGTNIAKMEKLDAKMASIDTKITAQVPVQEAEDITSAKAIAESAYGNFAAAGTAGAPTAEEAAKLLDVQGKNNTPRDWEGPSSQAKNLARRLARNQDFADLAASQDLTPQEMAQKLITDWVEDPGIDNSAALQLAARDEFGLQGARDTRASENALQLYDQYGAGYRAFARAQYRATQQYLEQNDIKFLTIYRGSTYRGDPGIAGIEWGKSGEVDLHVSAMSAFTTDAHTAGVWADKWIGIDKDAYQLVVSGDVPAERVIAIAKTGLGHSNMDEVVVLGGADRLGYASAINGTSNLGNVIAKQVSDVAQAAELTPEAAAAAEATAQSLGGTFSQGLFPQLLPPVDTEAEAPILQAVQDALANNGVEFHTDAIDLGSTVHDYMDARLGAVADNGNAAFDILNATADLTPEQAAWVEGDNSLHGGVSFTQAQSTYAMQLRQETIRLLQEARDTGGAELNIFTDEADYSNKVGQILQEVQQVMPTDWLEASNDQGGLYAMAKGAEEQGGGYYLATKDTPDGVIALQMGRGDTANNSYTLATHEFGHRVEDSVNGIAGLERQFYNARTARDDLVDLTNGISGKTRLDAFADEYLGRDPFTLARRGSLTDASGDPLRGFTSYELLSTGLQWVLGNQYQSAWYLARDEEFHKFILGILFGAKDIT